MLDGGRCAAFHPPRLAQFAEAARFVAEVGDGADVVLVAIDQPTVVANEAGSRPVDRVAASLVGRLRGGVQPARRGGTGAAMFGDAAPVWRFLDAIGAAQDPLAARSATSGRFVMEVFPALALPELVPAIWARRRAAKYNPAARLFAASDWPLVASGVAAFARGLGAGSPGAGSLGAGSLGAGSPGAGSLAEWADTAAGLGRPRKADQDRLDAAICVAVALAWRHGPAGSTLQLRDARSGLMATIASGEVRAVLVDAARRLGVSVDGVPAAVPVP